MQVSNTTFGGAESEILETGKKNAIITWIKFYILRKNSVNQTDERTVFKWKVTLL